MAMINTRPATYIRSLGLDDIADTREFRLNTPAPTQFLRRFMAEVSRDAFPDEVRFAMDGSSDVTDSRRKKTAQF